MPFLVVPFQTILKAKCRFMLFRGAIDDFGTVLKKEKSRTVAVALRNKLKSQILLALKTER